MPNLMLHAGSQAIDREVIATCPTPQATDTWQPIPHGQLLGLVTDTLERNGLEVVNQAHALGRDGDRYFGLLEVRNGQPVEDYSLVVGLRNSHDMSYPAGLVIGSSVLVCDNLAFSGEVVLARRHTVHIQRDLPQLVNRAVGQLGDLRHQQDERIDAYKHTRLADALAHDLFVRTVDSRVLPVTKLPHALKEFREPSHAEFLDDGHRTAWTFFNSVTEVLKGRTLDALPRRTQALHGLLDSACGLAA
jgi:Domain of unknown function (DUF932)